jgi:hypothetical protein
MRQCAVRRCAGARVLGCANVVVDADMQRVTIHIAFLWTYIRGHVCPGCRFPTADALTISQMIYDMYFVIDCFVNRKCVE